MQYKTLLEYIQAIENTPTDDGIYKLFKYVKLRISFHTNLKILLLCSSVAENFNAQALFVKVFQIPCLSPKVLTDISDRLRKSNLHEHLIGTVIQHLLHMTAQKK